MKSNASPILPAYLRKRLFLTVLVAVGLVIAGRFLVPAASVGSTLAALSILFVYGWMALWCPFRLHHRDPEILHGAVVFGLLAAGVFAGEIILEYIFLPASNTLFGVVEFGTVFALYLAAALITAFRSRNVKNAVLTSMASAFIASLAWVIVVLVVFYSFRGSQRQALVMRAEGNYEDFARSGMKNFDAFLMEDFMGAIFFHLMLGLLVAAILGFFGGLLGKILARLRLNTTKLGSTHH